MLHRTWTLGKLDHIALTLGETVDDPIAETREVR